MISLDKAKELLEQQDGVDGVEVCKDKYLQAQFANRVNPQEPHVLIVHPLTEKLTLRVLVPNISKVRSGASELFRVLQDLNYRLLIGKIGTDGRDGEVAFEINHPCQDGDVTDPSPEVFARLIEVAIETARDVHLTATHVGMTESGVPADVARKFIEQFREQEKEDGDDEETL